MLIQKVFDHIFDYNSKLPWLAAKVLVDTALKTWQISFYVYAAVSVSQLTSQLAPTQQLIF